jgi:cell division septum initiation protein DivIVA
MRKRDGGEQQFPVVRRGYDRAQVDAFLAARTRWATEAWVRVQQLEREVTELRELVASLERDGEPTDVAAEHAHAGEIEAERRATEIVEAAEDRAAELSEASRRNRQEASELIERAQADVAEAERRANEIVETAAARAAELAEESRGQREEGARNDVDARGDVQRFLDQVEERMRRPDQGLPSTSDKPPF